jgi:hypothetical protein
MIDDTVKQTRCTTCDADHEYREGKAPAARRRHGALASGVAPTIRPRAESAPAAEPLDPTESSEPPLPMDPEPLAAHVEAAEDPEPDEPQDGADRDEWPVHRPLIRATLPRPEGQAPERKATEFTIRPTGGRFDSRGGHRKGHRPMRHAQGQPSGQSRFGGTRGAGAGQQGQRQSSGQGQRGGNRPAQGGRPGPGRGQRPGGGGRKRGR